MFISLVELWSFNLSWWGQSWEFCLRGYSHFNSTNLSLPISKLTSLPQKCRSDPGGCEGKREQEEKPGDCSTLIPEHPFHYSKSSCIMLFPHSPRGYGWQIPGAMETFGKHLKNHKCFHKLWLLTSVLPRESRAITASTKPKLIRIHSPGANSEQ